MKTSFRSIGLLAYLAGSLCWSPCGARADALDRSRPIIDRAERRQAAVQLQGFVKKLTDILPVPTPDDIASVDRRRRETPNGYGEWVKRDEALEASPEFETIRMNSTMAEVGELLTRILDNDIALPQEIVCWYRITLLLDDAETIAHDVAGLSRAQRLRDNEVQPGAFAFLYRYLARTLSSAIVMPYLVEQAR